MKLNENYEKKTRLFEVTVIRSERLFVTVTKLIVKDMNLGLNGNVQILSLPSVLHIAN